MRPRPERELAEGGQTLDLSHLRLRHLALAAVTTHVIVEHDGPRERILVAKRLAGWMLAPGHNREARYRAVRAVLLGLGWRERLTIDELMQRCEITERYLRHG